METSELGKLFVGGLSWETTEGSLTDYFKKYGEVMESVVLRDRLTGKPRGFGFVRFSELFMADKALEEEKHIILGKPVEVKKALPRSETLYNQYQQDNRYNNSSNVGDNNEQASSRKIFVGGLSPNITEEEFKSYFEEFGNVTDVVVMYDSLTHRPRGFGFITFDSEEVVEQVMKKKFHQLNDKVVEVKRALPRQGSNGNNSNGNYSNYYNGGFDSHNLGVGSGSGWYLSDYRYGVYPHYIPSYGYFPSYVPSISGYGYFNGGYSGVGYASPWNMTYAYNPDIDRTIGNGGGEQDIERPNDDKSHNDAQMPVDIKSLRVIDGDDNVSSSSIA